MKKVDKEKASWICAFCGGVFMNKGAQKKHELGCNANPNIKKGLDQMKNKNEQIEDVLWQRRYRVYDLKTRGISSAAIAKVMGVSIRTVYDDWDFMTDNVLEQLRNTPKEKIIVRELMSASKMEDEVMSLFYGVSSDNPIAKANLAGRWHDLWKERITKMQQFGILPKTADQMRVEFSETRENLSKKTTEELLTEHANILKKIAEIKARRADSYGAPIAT
jgi:hypothetical protein